MNNNGAVEQFIESIKEYESESSKTNIAIVSNVDEEGVVWVNLAGSDKSTPTASASAEVKAGDIVNVEWRNNKLYIAGNYTDPSAGGVRVNKVEQSAKIANQAAANAVADANTAREAAEDAKATAGNVHAIAEQAQTDADKAKKSADNASEYAARALGNLSTVQNVAETLNWITAHGTMKPTTDTALDPSHVYFVEDSNGPYIVGELPYSVVTEPDVDDIATYYELSIDESLNNFIATHLVLTDAGLSIFGDTINDPLTYALVSSVALSFILNGEQQLKVGYESSIDDYGVLSNNHIALGSGAGVKFDNYGHTVEGARGRFVWEIRDNGHLSLKLY